MLRPRAFILPVLLLFLVTSAALGASVAVPPSPPDLARDVQTLTAPGMDGRGSGTPGGDRAARQIAGWLEAAGLQPGGDDGTFFQSFTIATGTALAPQSRLALATPAVTELALDRDWRPHGGSLVGEVRGELVFAGYGIDYDGMGVTGKIVIALDGSPAHLAPDRATRLEKLVAARRRGAAALLLVSDALPSLATTAPHVAIRSASLTRAAADRLLAASGRTVEALERELATRRARPFPVQASATLTVALVREERRDVNVVGLLPGSHPELGHEAVVVGAHYDHLGEVNGAVHPGADDNASGTAAVVGMARAFAAAPRPPRTLVFALFGAEESGLVGSAHYTRQPTVSLDRTVAMVNLDMVGRLGSAQLRVAGVDSGRGLRQVVSEAAEATGLHVEPHGDPWGPSDHLSFYRAGTPVLFFTTGVHADYHRASDVAARIDTTGLARVAAVAMRSIRTLAEGPRPAYAAVVSAQRDRSGAAGPFLGIVADLRGGDGIRLSDVLPDGAASRAGLTAGDVIVRFAGRSVADFETLRRLIGERRVGDRVEIVYLRQGEDRTALATLGARP